MTQKLSRARFVIALSGGLALLGSLSSLRGYPPLPDTGAERSQKTVYLASGLTDEQVLVFSAGMKAYGRRGTLLIDSPGARASFKGFVDAYEPSSLILVRNGSDNTAELEAALGRKIGKTIYPDQGVGQPERLVICPAEPRRRLLHAACLAGVLEAPLHVIQGHKEETADLRRQIQDGNFREIFVVGDVKPWNVDHAKTRVVRLREERDVAASYLRQQKKLGPITTVVVANSADISRNLGGMSGLAPWLTLQKRAALVLTNEAGTDTDAEVARTLQEHQLGDVESLIVLATLQAIPPERRPNPVPGKDAAIDMEPLTPKEKEPCSFATGRLFDPDPAQVALLLARQQLLGRGGAPPKALVVSNPAGGLPLLETFSRHTAKELGNRGYQTTLLYGNFVTKEALRRLLPEQDVFLWEGHHSTLVNDYGVPEWPEPLRPSLVFLQSCLALCEPEASPLLRRGAIAVLGSSTRTYSGSGGACSLAFFDALLYENRSLGASLRQAKNFLIAYSLLKEKRLGDDAKLGGANLRSAWAFSLWGDPTTRLPSPEPPAGALAPVRCQVSGNTIVLRQPEQPYELDRGFPYQVRMLPNARLAGLLRKDIVDSERWLVPFLFAEVALPKARPGSIPRLSSRVPDDHWVFCWDGRRRCGYLLVMPRARDTGELRFHVDWQTEESRASRQ